MKRLVVCIALAVFGWSCQPEEQNINLTDASWRYIAANSATPSQLTVVRLPNNSVDAQDAFKNANGIALTDTIRKIVEFRENLYLLLPSAQRIEVINSKTYKSVASINTAPHSVLDICFPNGTSAYTANGDSTVSIIDLTINKMLDASRDITVGKNPVAIAAYENYICVCNQGSNTISIIRTNDVFANTVTQTLPTKPYPTFIQTNTDEKGFVIVCLGNGKTGGADQRTSAYAQFYEVAGNGSIVGEAEILETGMENRDVFPRNLTVTPSGFAYIPLGSEIAVVNIRQREYFRASAIGTFDVGMYNTRRNELVFLNNSNATSEIVTIDPVKTTITNRYQQSMRLRTGFAY